MAVDPRSPVIVGVGQHLHRAATVEEGDEPVELMAAAVGAAVLDASQATLPAAVDSIRVVDLLSWRYGNPAAVLARRLGVEAAQLAVSRVGGNSPQALVNQTALDIAAGRADLVVLAGGEAWRTRSRARREGVALPWPRATTPADAPPTLVGEDLELTHPTEAALRISLPAQVYALFEPAIRAAAGRTPDDHLATIAELWSRFSAIAATNPHAWTQRPMSPAEVAAASPSNRMVCSPYRKVMNANNDVDMAAAVLMCSAQRADELGVPRDGWVFPVAGTDCHEHAYVSHRWTFADAPAVRTGGRRVLQLAGTGIGDVAIVDLYSCFPSAVQLGAAALGLPLDAQLTRTGGLSFAGGPWNDYVMHAIATVVTELRDRPGERALVWANGGFLTKHSFGVYATEPPVGGFRHDAPQDVIDALPARPLATGDDATTSSAVIEAYTVEHERSGSPQRALAACLLADGRRAWAVSADPATAAAMTVGEWVGTVVSIDAVGTLHV